MAIRRRSSAGTATDPSAVPAAAAGRPAVPATPRRSLTETSLPRRKQPKVWALGISLSALAAVIGGIAYSAAGSKVPVVVVAGHIAPGEQVTRADLAISSMSIDPAIHAVPGGQINDIVGQFATTDLQPGTLLAPEQLQRGRRVSAGFAQVGLALKPGQMPQNTLLVGDNVEVVITDKTGENGQAAQSRPYQATIAGLHDQTVDGTTPVDVQLHAADAAAVAAGATADQATLVLLPSGPTK